MSDVTSSNCDHNCSSCGASCVQRDPASLVLPANKDSKIGKVIGVVSGKGGVGKSVVTSLSAVASSRMGYSTAILDADITGPSIPKIFGVHEKTMGTEEGMMVPVETRTGIKLMSVNLILDDESDPVAWRGPVISGVVKQFWTDVVWGNVDYMFVDMPPGTGDVMLTTFQSLPVNGIIIVTSPQELVTVIVEKALKLAEKMDVPVLGIVENMSYLPCPHCNEKIKLFGESHIEEICDKYGIKLITQIPVMPEIAGMSDSGTMEDTDISCIDDLGMIFS
ncbi:MAG: Mrp/NBP35 family ATP-binding protein [Lachnospiraceae bacterium]|nr:Mrp/NBP35 family ATP-binding protein [Lachnospiraceae bacterium]